MDHLQGFYLTKLGFAIPMCTGTVSLLASALITWIIVKSGNYRTYHCIIAFMAFWDMLLSLSIGLSSIPMPKDVIYDFQGPVLGTTRTCEAQAFVFLVSTGFSLCSNMFLNIYYVLTIRYQISELKFRRYAWPPFLLFSTVFISMLTIVFLVGGFLNPTPSESFCIVGNYPHYCNDKDIPCIRGSISSFQQDYFSKIVFGFVGITLLILFASMILIIHASYEYGRKMRVRMTLSSSSSMPASSRLRNSMAKDITVQALMYVFAFVLTWTFSIVTFFKDTTGIAIAKQIFQPLQGFFNALIFLYHKVYDLKRVEPDLSAYECLGRIIRSPYKQHQLYISNLTLVDVDKFVEDRAKREAKVISAIAGVRSGNFQEDDSIVRSPRSLRRASIKAGIITPSDCDFGSKGNESPHDDMFSFDDSRKFDLQKDAAGLKTTGLRSLYNNPSECSGGNQGSDIVLTDESLHVGMFSFDDSRKSEHQHEAAG
jgi:hypothetical protein